MISVLENARNREQVSSVDEDLYAGDEEVGKEDELPTMVSVPAEPKVDLGQDSVNLYFAEVGRTALLSDEETKILTSQIEDGAHLGRLEKEWVARHGAPPTPIELLLVLADRLTGARLLFDTICQYLELPSHERIARKVWHPGLRSAIDNRIDQDLSDAIAEITGESPTKTENSMIELSLDSRLIPWSIMEQAGLKTSLAELREQLQSREFRHRLEVHRLEIGKHFEQTRERARQASNRMIQANLRLVISVAKGRIGLGVPLPDLIQEGNIGLMQAVRKFDRRRGTRFSTYAIPWIWQAVNRAVNDQSRMVRLPGHIVDALTKITRASNKLAERLGRQPTENELASETGLPSKNIESLLELSAIGPVSLDTPVGEDGSQLGDFIADEATVQPEEEATASLLREELSKTLGSLTPRERRVLELRFGLDNEYSRTLAEVGTELGLTKERIRQIEKEALAKLRHPSHSRELVGYLG